MDIRLPSVEERDLDLLLMEAFVSHPGFSSWFLSSAGIASGPCRVRAASHSVSTMTGESDLEIDLVEAERGVHRLLIEDKLAAPLQPAQAERYLVRGRDYVAAGACRRFTSVIVAPAAYFASAEERKGFQARLDLEAVHEWFREREAALPGFAFKSALLRAGIERGRRGYQGVPNAVVTEFWQRYWQLCMRLAPELQMPRPEPKPFWSSFVLFKPAELPAGTRLVHKVRCGHVDLELKGLGDCLPEIARALGGRIPEGVVIERAHMSAALRLVVTPIEMTQPWSTAEPALTAAIDAASSLLLWLRAEERSITALLSAARRFADDGARSA